MHTIEIDKRKLNGIQSLDSNHQVDNPLTSYIFTSSLATIEELLKDLHCTGGTYV